MTIYPWQQTQWQNLLKQHKQQRLAHAYLFAGVAGLGKTQFAKYWAQTLLCEEKCEQPCQRCRSCHFMRVGSHPDFYVVTPGEKDKSIKVEQIRTLLEALAQTAQRRGRQIALIHPAELMNRASSNALLKTLEEPSGQVIIILVANQPSLLPATLLSRCQKILFTSPVNTLAIPWLQQHLAVSSEEAQSLLQAAAGAPLQALTLGQQSFHELHNMVLQSLGQLLQKKVSASQVASEFVKHDLALVLRLLLSLWLDVLRLGLEWPIVALENQNCIKQLQMWREKVNLPTVAQLLSYLLQVKQDLHKVAGLNVLLLMEGILLRWQMQIPVGLSYVG